MDQEELRDLRAAQDELLEAIEKAAAIFVSNPGVASLSNDAKNFAVAYGILADKRQGN